MEARISPERFGAARRNVYPDIDAGNGRNHGKWTYGLMAHKVGGLPSAELHGAGRGKNYMILTGPRAATCVLTAYRQPCWTNKRQT